MNKTIRYGAHFILAAYLIAPLVLPGCILVVEEDRDRHHRLYGTEWRLEVVFYRTQFMASDYGDAYMTFVDESRFQGESQCGPFSGTYTLNDEDAVSVTSIQQDRSGCQAADVSAIFLDQLARAETLTVSEEELRISTGGSDYLVFSGR